MNTDVETKSEELMAEMKKLDVTVRASFKQTDALLDKRGLNRSTIHGAFETARRQMTEDEKKIFVKYEEKLGLKMSAEVSPHNSDNHGKPSKKRMRTSLVNKV
jgi:hypothetical protein